MVEFMFMLVVCAAVFVYLPFAICFWYIRYGLHKLVGGKGRPSINGNSLVYKFLYEDKERIRYGRVPPGPAEQQLPPQEPFVGTNPYAGIASPFLRRLVRHGSWEKDHGKVQTLMQYEASLLDGGPRGWCAAIGRGSTECSYPIECSIIREEMRQGYEVPEDEVRDRLAKHAAEIAQAAKEKAERESQRRDEEKQSWVRMGGNP